jgi:hypothetical protein
MLIKGEGGPPVPQRSLSLLRGQSAADVPAVKAALGQLYLEGRLVPHDVQEAVRLIAIGQFDYDSLFMVMRLLAANPDVRLSYPGSLLYDMLEAAGLNEPGAMATLIDLKLSHNSQFRDKPGGCTLVETAVKRGDESIKQHVPECRAN